MRRYVGLALLAVAGVLSQSGVSAAQDQQSFLSVGETAPDIQVVGATRYGVLSEAVNLSDFKGETVVLAFFFKARTGG